MVRRRTMKEKLSISLEKDTLDRINSLVENKRFRSRSHVIEYAVNILERTE